MTSVPNLHRSYVWKYDCYLANGFLVEVVYSASGKSSEGKEQTLSFFPVLPADTPVGIWAAVLDPRESHVLGMAK